MCGDIEKVGEFEGGRENHMESKYIFQYREKDFNAS